MLDGVEVARKILHHIASCSPHVTNLGQPTERTCALCLTFIDEARAVFNYEPWPAIAHTPKAEPDTDSLMWLYTHCLAIGMSRGSESGKMAHDIALFTVDMQEEIKKLKEEPKDARFVMIVEVFIVAALKEMGEEVFLLLPEQRGGKLKQIMLHIIKNKKAPLAETKTEPDKWYPFPEHKPLVGDRVYFVRGGLLYDGWRRHSYFESEKSIYYDHNKGDVTHFMVHKLPQMPNDENTIKPSDMLLAAGYVQLPDGRWNYAPRPGFVPSAEALEYIKNKITEQGYTQ